MVKLPESAKSTPKMAKAHRKSIGGDSTPNVKKSPKALKDTPKQAKVTSNNAIETPKSAKKSKQIKKEVMVAAAESVKKSPKNKDLDKTVEVKSPKAMKLNKAAKSPSPTKASPKKVKKNKTENKKKVPVKSEDEVESSQEMESEEEVTIKSAPVNSDKKKASKQAKKSKMTASKIEANSPDCGIFVANLNFETTFSEFKSYFEKHGEITNIFLSKNKKDRSLNRGYGLITFATAEQAKEALAAKHEINGRELVVRMKEASSEKKKRTREESEESDNKKMKEKPVEDAKLYVSQLQGTSKKEVRKYFNQFGVISMLVMPMSRDTRDSRGFAFITYKEPSMAQKALKTKDHQIGDKKIVVLAALAKEVKDRKDVVHRENEMFVGSLPFNTKVKHIKDHFSTYGEIEHITLPRNPKTQRNSGFGFVAFKTKEGLEAAVAAKHVLNKREVLVKISKPKGTKVESKNETEQPKAKKAKLEVKQEEDDDDDLEVLEDDDEEQDDEDEEEDDEDEEEDDEDEDQDNEEDSDEMEDDDESDE